MGFDSVLNDRKAQTCPSLIARASLIDPVEALEHPFLCFEWNPHPRVGHLQNSIGSVAPDRHGYSAPRRVTKGVVEQVPNYQLNLLGITVDPYIRLDVVRKVHTLGFCRDFERQDL